MILLDIDPNVVKPGWTPLIIILVLGAVMVFLYRSMRRQFSKIQAPREADLAASRTVVGSELRRSGPVDPGGSAADSAGSTGTGPDVGKGSASR